MTNKEFLKSISLDGEEWRDVVGYEGYYMVSNLGRILASKRDIVYKNGRIHHLEPKLVKPQVMPNGYIQVRLWKDNKEKKMYVHRIVGEAFISNPNNYPEIDHIDAIRDNNVVSNLQWVSRSMNKLNPITRKRNSESKKGNLALIERTSKPVVRINPNNPNDVKIYPSAKSAGEIEGFNWSHIGDVCRGERNKSQGYYWKFLSDYEASLNQQCQSSL